jgi:hypothetical protein
MAGDTVKVAANFLDPLFRGCFSIISDTSESNIHFLGGRGIETIYILNAKSRPNEPSTTRTCGGGWTHDTPTSCRTLKLDLPCPWLDVSDSSTPLAVRVMTREGLLGPIIHLCFSYITSGMVFSHTFFLSDYLLHLPSV